MKKVNVIVIDDSAVVREILTSKLGQRPDINVVGAAIDLLSEKIVAASYADFEKIKSVAKKNQEYAVKKHVKYLTRIETTGKLIAVGASTGGTTALEALFKSFDKGFPPTAGPSSTCRNALRVRSRSG
ncbi:MAG: hypothetical protein JXD23_08180 [Spirochaetales bacterium]|nr:hypothetical protein [Spirochaetales bacterium]